MLKVISTAFFAAVFTIVAGVVGRLWWSVFEIGWTLFGLL